VPDITKKQLINTHMVLCVNRIPPKQKKQFPEVLCLFQIPTEQKPDSLLSGKFPSLLSREIPQEEHHFVALSTGATSPLLLRSLTTTLEQIALGEILLLEEIQG
jgi:hypothetical protein